MPCPSCGAANRPGRLYCGGCGTRLASACPACGSPNEPGERFCGRCGVALEGADAGRTATPVTLAGGRYQVQRLLGEGGKKRVYLATDTRLERDVAVALIKTDGLDEAGLDRVRREARAMGRLGDHPHVVTVFDVGEEDGRPFIVSQYMAGGSVDDLLQSAAQHRLPLEQTVRIAGQICRALQHAHESGIVHRDVKPSNVWLTADGTAKLGDFGLAVARDRSRLTVEGMMVGTVAYMPPEQALGRAPEARTDLYALGAMLYEMVTGRPPFLGDDAIAIISQHLNTTPVAPSWHNSDVPVALERLILELLAKSPDDRPASASAVQTALATVSLRASAIAPRIEQANPLDGLAGGIFVGREQETEELRRTVDEARAGQGRLVLLAGEPGIGKTRIASELGTYARVRGFQVLWGRCHETGGAPAYWPWVQIIRAYLHDRDAQRVRSEMGTGAADIAQVVSDVRERLPDLPPPPSLEPEQARFRLFDSIAAFFRSATSGQPLVLVLDDVHWADQPSLLLLQFLAREMGPARLLVIGTYRDVEVTREHPLFEALGAVTREAVTRRFLLRGLGRDDVARYIEMTAGVAPPADLVATVHAETEGNPFFVGEVVRLLVSEGRFGAAGKELATAKLVVPQSVREVIGRRLQRLSPGCNQVLGIASALGREFGADALEPLSGLRAEALLESLDEAIAGRIVTKVPDAVGRYRFSHALVRDTLYEDVSPAQRVRLHRRIGEVLETLYATRPDRHLAELAFHFARAAEDGRDVGKAIDYGRRAGERALAQLAHEEGAKHYQAALDLLTAHRPADDAARADILLGLGETRRRTGELEEARTAVREAAETARRLGDAERLARAALAYGGHGFVFGLYDAYEVALLEEALAALGDADSTLRARVAARLAMGLYASEGRDRCDGLSDEAVAMARRLGNPAALAFALHSRHAVLWGPRRLEERLAIASEIVRLAEAAGDKEQLARGRHFRIVDLLEQGDMGTAYREMEAQSRLADELRQPLYQWHRAMYRAMRALLEGRTDEAEQLANAALMLGERASPDALDTYGVQIFTARRDQGRLDELEPSVAATVEMQPHVPGWRIALAYLYAEGGRDDDARREIATAFDALPTLPDDAVWMPSMAMLANACALEGDAERGAPVYDALLPYAGRAVIVGAGVVCAGPVAFYLGLLATTMRRTVEAALHFETAIAMCERLDARPWLARTQFAYARLLAARDDGDDRAKATTFLARALDAGQALGMKRLVERALALKLEMEGIDASIDMKTSIGEVASTVQRERPDLRAHAAPDGTVTVLFTDIEGFAAITARLGEERAQELLLAHGTIVREQVAAHDGSEVRSRGDGFMVVFSSARRAILCAIAIQRALVGYSARHPAEPIRGRIGLHTGEVLRDSIEFIDTNVTAAAHVASKAHGGEILVSALLRGLTEGPGDLRFGELRAVDMPRGSNVREVCEVLWAGGPGTESGPAPAVDGAYVFRQEGDYWTLAHEGTICRVRDTKGLQHIAHLLRHPGQHFDARELVVESSAEAPAPRMGAAQLGADGLAVAGLGDAGAVLDATAKAAYKRRVEELREELEEAEQFNDVGRATAAREEIDFIAGQLSAAVGLGSRDRKASSSSERARLTVTKRIKDAVARVRERHPGLGHHLAAHVKTGYLCAYLPDPERPIPWTL